MTRGLIWSEQKKGPGAHEVTNTLHILILKEANF